MWIRKNDENWHKVKARNLTVCNETLHTQIGVTFIVTDIRPNKDICKKCGSN